MLAWIVNYQKEKPAFRQLVHLPDNFQFGVDDPYEHLVMGSNEQVVPYEDHDDLLGLPPPELGKRGERQYLNHSEPCNAVLFHGPGHQSRTKCQLTGPHEVHQAVYGGYDRTAEWKGDKAFTGYFDDPPSVED